MTRLLCCLLLAIGLSGCTGADNSVTKPEGPVPLPDPGKRTSLGGGSSQQAMPGSVPTK